MAEKKKKIDGLPRSVYPKKVGAGGKAKAGSNANRARKLSQPGRRRPMG